MEIIELRELLNDEELGSSAGYYAEGHHDPQQFAIAVNKEFELASQGCGVVCTHEVERGYLLKIDLPDSDGLWSIHRCTMAKEGAFPATFVFS